MAAMAIRLVLMALGSAPVDGTPLPDQTVHLRAGDVVTIRLDGSSRKWVRSGRAYASSWLRRKLYAEATAGRHYRGDGHDTAWR